MSFERDVIRRLAALEAALANVVRLGRVASVEKRPYRVDVNVGTADAPVLTGPIPAIIPRAGSAIQWSPLTVGEGCLVLAPGGGDVRIALPAVLTGALEPYAPGGAPADDTLYVSGPVLVGSVAAGGAPDDTLTALWSEFRNHVHTAPAAGGVTSKPGVL